MRRLFTACVIACLAMSVVACDSDSKSEGSVSGGSKSSEGSSGPAASMVDAPAFTDPFDGSVAVPSSISPAVVAESNYEGEWGPVAAPNPTATESDGALVIDETTDYKAYDAGFLNGSQGTFELLYTPAQDILESYTAANHPEWKKFGDYDPPGNGMLIDTIGWRAAPTGSYGVVAGFTEATATVSWGIWDGSMWHYVNYSESPWEVRPYRITASYGPAGVRLYVDGELAAEDTSYTGGIDTGQPLVLGQAPWYWPYGPHSLPGTIREFKYSDSQQ